MMDEQQKPQTSFNPNYYKTQFKGMCYNCGKWGHKGAACPDKNNPQSERKPCDHCGLKSHPSFHCFELEENAGRRPPGWKSRINKENGNSKKEATKETRYEMVYLCEECGSPGHSKGDCPTKKMGNKSVKRRDMGYMTLDDEDDSSDSETGHEVSSLGGYSSSDYGYMFFEEEYFEENRSDDWEKTLENACMRIFINNELTDEAKREWVQKTRAKLADVHVMCCEDFIRKGMIINELISEEIGEADILTENEHASIINCCIQLDNSYIKGEGDIREAMFHCQGDLKVSNEWITEVYIELKKIGYNTLEAFIRRSIDVETKLQCLEHKGISQRGIKLIYDQAVKIYLVNKMMKRVRSNEEQEQRWMGSSSSDDDSVTITYKKHTRSTKKEKEPEKGLTIQDDVSSLTSSIKCYSIPRDIQIPPQFQQLLTNTEKELGYKVISNGDIQEGKLWIGDTGASCHMTNQKDGFYEMWSHNAKAHFAQGDEAVLISYAGKWRGKQKCISTEKTHLEEGPIIEMNQVLYIPSLHHNLYSITQAISEGGKLYNEGSILHIKFNDKIVKFDYKIKTKNGYIMAAIIEATGIHKQTKDETKVMNINEFHNIMHQSKTYMLRTAPRLNIK